MVLWLQEALATVSMVVFVGSILVLAGFGEAIL
jgi:hypothetical protein